MNPSNYEEAVTELKQIVERLERGNLELDESLQLYERGVFLTAFCDQRLAAVESRMMVLNESGFQVRPAPLSPGVEEEGQA